MTTIDAGFTAAPKPAAHMETATKVLLGILLAVVALGALAFTFGPVVLTLAALTAVPCIFAFFFAVSRP